MKAKHLGRYKDIAFLLMRHARGRVWSAARDAPPFLAEELQEEQVEEGKPEELADDLEDLGPTFVKLGQLLSTRTDLLPKAYIEALCRLQDDVDPFPFEEVRRIVEAELDQPLEHAYAAFEERPHAAASLGQVHRARLRDGTPVAVKIQRPGVRDRVVEDLEALDEIAGLIDANTDVGRRYAFRTLLDEFRKTLFTELDYEQEMRHMRRVKAIVEDEDRLLVPEPFESHSTSRLLTMTWVEGRKIGDLDEVERIELTDGLADALSRAYLDQILVEGFFHADPHPGNVVITEDGRLALLDLGMVGRLDPETRHDLLRLLLMMSEGRGADVARLFGEMCRPLEDRDEHEYERQVMDVVSRHRDASVEEAEPGRVLLQVARAAAMNGYRPPPALAMLGRTLSHLAEVARMLDPRFRPREVLRKRARELLRRQLLESTSPGNMFETMLEMNELVRELPSRLNRLLDALASNEFRVNVRAFDEVRLIEGFQKVANRIAVGLIVAGLVIGAALLSHVETSFRILGYPGIPMLLFLLAAGIGFGLVINILRHDESRRGRR